MFFMCCFVWLVLIIVVYLDLWCYINVCHCYLIFYYKLKVVAIVYSFMLWFMVTGFLFVSDEFLLLYDSCIGMII